jgi:excisionase family DNA binding protein
MDERPPQVDRLAYRMHEAAEVLGISRSKVYEMAYRGELPTIMIGAARRVPRRALEAWIDDQLAAQER